MGNSVWIATMLRNNEDMLKSNGDVYKRNVLSEVIDVSFYCEKESFMKKVFVVLFFAIICIGAFLHIFSKEPNPETLLEHFFDEDSVKNIEDMVVRDVQSFEDNGYHFEMTEYISEKKIGTFFCVIEVSKDGADMRKEFKGLRKCDIEAMDSSHEIFGSYKFMENTYLDRFIYLDKVRRIVTKDKLYLYCERLTTAVEDDGILYIADVDKLEKDDRGVYTEGSVKESCVGKFEISGTECCNKFDNEDTFALINPYCIEIRSKGYILKNELALVYKDGNTEVLMDKEGMYNGGYALEGSGASTVEGKKINFNSRTYEIERPINASQVESIIISGQELDVSSGKKVWDPFDNSE